MLNTEDLYNKILDTPLLCGRFELVEKTIFWNLYDGFEIEISIEPPDSCFEIQRRWLKNICIPLTHWHPDEDEVYSQVCNIGLKGNVLVIRENWFGVSILYMGDKEKCPYPADKKWSWGKIYYLLAK